MGNHLAYRSGNPALNASVFKGFSKTSENTMTLEGTVNKCTFCLFLLFATGYYGFINANPLFYGFGFIAIILALATMFRKHWAPYTVPMYIFCKGLFVGTISKSYFLMFYEGIVLQAILLTGGIFATLLFLYKTKIIKATENFKLGIVAATGGIFLVYLVSFIMSFFGSNLSIMSINNASTFSIGFSMFVVVIASLNLVLDFDFIEEASEMNVPKYMEWYGAFGLMVTLIWLYLEILRLLAKMNSRR